MNATIPVYRADGRLYDHVPEPALARLQPPELIARVVRHRKGHNNRAIFFVPPGEAPMPRTVYMGTRYSFQDHLQHGVCWDLKRLRRARWGTNYAPDEVRPILLQVVTDCLVRA